MRILAISDKVVPHLYSPQIRDVVGQIDLVVSCGDLPLYYVDFVASTLDVPCILVHGNHAAGEEFKHHDSLNPQPRNPLDIDERVVCEGGLLMAGLDGCIRYNSNPRFQYTQGEMWLKIGHLAPSLLWNRATEGRFLDVLVAHSPPAGIHDGPDRAHTGFNSFLWFMRRFKPRYLLHGHKHVYRHDEVIETRYYDTQVINVFPWKVIEIDAQ